jgi:ribosomal protein S18 acetylase RimI-like enzyme
MDIELKSMLEYSLADTVAISNRAFEGYIVHAEFSVPMVVDMIRCNAIDLGASRVALRGGEPIGFAVIARRGRMCRLAGFAIVPEARGRGVGKWFTERLLEEAKARGERAMALECIEQNTPAVRLYEGCGFRTIRRLVGYTLSQADGGEKAALEEVDMREAALRAIQWGLPDLPWQVAGETLAQRSLPDRAYRLGDAFSAITDPSGPAIWLRMIVVKPESRGQGQAARLVRALMSQFPGKKWNVAAVCPEEIGGLFERMGFARESLSQLQMEASLAS